MKEKEYESEEYIGAYESVRLYELCRAGRWDAAMALQQGADNLRMEKEREIKNINARATALANSLRERPDRPTTESGAVSGSACACSGASGAQLARGDGEFLARYSADAARLSIELDKCVKQYEAVRQLRP